MINGLVNYIKNIFHTIKKEDVIKNLDNILVSLNDDVIPTLDAVIKEGNLDKIKNSNYLNILKVSSGYKAKDSRELLVKIKLTLNNIVKSSKKLESLVTTHLNDVITDKTITIQDAAIMKMVSDIGNLTLYTSDFLYLVTLSDNETDFPKKKISDIKDNISNYGSLLKVYAKDINKRISEIEKLPDNYINVDSSKIGMLDKIVSKFTKGIDMPTVSGFNGNPIYHIRMWLVDLEVSKYEALKDKKKLIELKLLDLKLKEKNEENPAIKKQIEYWENKLAKTEYEIANIEED